MNITKNQMTVMGIFVENESYEDRANVPNAVMAPETKEKRRIGFHEGDLEMTLDKRGNHGKR